MAPAPGTRSGLTTLEVDHAEPTLEAAVEGRRVQGDTFGRADGGAVSQPSGGYGEDTIQASDGLLDRGDSRVASEAVEGRDPDRLAVGGGGDFVTRAAAGAAGEQE
jgi:hypothetical protein